MDCKPTELPVNSPIRAEACKGRLPSYIPKQHKTGGNRYVRSVAFDEWMMRRIETESAIAKSEGRCWKFSEFSREAMRLAFQRLERERANGKTPEDRHFTSEYRASQRKLELDRRARITERDSDCGVGGDEKFAYEIEEQERKVEDGAEWICEEGNGGTQGTDVDSGSRLE